ncbi:MAG: glycoside hydrolase family 2 TIM barrel-domain containing protein, partial [Bacteroidales bacterium]|nr:glycoside hydrolase family 2 TIM barrel-domain containing protein [Bacteroidales bacterium]
ERTDRIGGRTDTIEESTDAIGERTDRIGGRTDTIEESTDVTEQKTVTIEMTLPMGPDLNTWDEFEPHLYNFTAELNHNGEKSRETVRFGMREISTSGKQILVNGNPVFMRGNVDCAVFPLTGYPEMDVDGWLDIFRQLRAYGLNHVRFHSWCPPEAAFDAADQLGFYLQPEGPTWPNHGTSLGNGRSIDQYIYEETERILEEYGNHPSFCMYASGNEPRGNYVAFLEDFLRYWKKQDPRRIYTGASIGGSWKECQENEFHVKGGARGLPWSRQRPGSSFDYERNISRFDAPFITHELGQYCVYPDFKEIDKYTGSYRAYNFELFRDLARKNHMDHLSELFLAASGELQKRCYKYEMEATLRTEGMSGYQLLGLNDFPGQGTALVGVLNAFYEPKGYAEADYFRQFCGPVTLLATLPKFVWEADETFSADLLLANYSSGTISDEMVSWKITADPDDQLPEKQITAEPDEILAEGQMTTDPEEIQAEGQINGEPDDILPEEQITAESNEILAEGQFSTGAYEVGKVAEIGSVQFDLSGEVRARKFTLSATMQGTSNSWDFWVFPKNLPERGTGIHITDTLDPVADSVLCEGGKVLLMAAGKVENGRDVVQYFTPVFWNTSWFKMRPPHTTGVLIRDDHPVFSNFPT